jgi:pimeloyl-ACP methyl ester carboxylesterase
MTEPVSLTRSASLSTAPPRLVLLPGAAGAGSFWDPVVKRLPSTWNARALDLPGLGSVPPHAGIRSYDDLVSYASQSFDGPSAVVAQSMGAYVALQLALRCPELVTHLVLVAATGGVDVCAFGATDWRREYANAFPAAAEWARARVPDLANCLNQLAIPVLLIWPTHDPLSPLSVAHALAEKIPLASIVTFPSDDHWVAQRFPEETAAAIRAFIT